MSNLLCGYLDQDSGWLLARNEEKPAAHFSTKVLLRWLYPAFCFGVLFARATGRVPCHVMALWLTRDMSLIITVRKMCESGVSRFYT